MARPTTERATREPPTIHPVRELDVVGEAGSVPTGLATVGAVTLGGVTVGGVRVGVGGEGGVVDGGGVAGAASGYLATVTPVPMSERS
jgi:hypothetical protein